ncbi:MAG: fibronectin type III domain-containing protein, partial [Planctomycetota bacterium]
MSKKLFCLLSFILFFGMVGDGRSADEIYFTELFEDGNFSSRGWYDNTSLVLSTTEHIPGSTSSAEFLFEVDATTPTSGGAIRKQFTETESVYLSFYIKHSSNWTGSNQSYHPHQFQFLTNLDGAWTGPAYTYTTIYIETNEGEPLLALQDSKNIDESNIDVDLTEITEERGIAGCNGNSDGTGVDDCYQSGPDYRNGKQWAAGSIYFQDSQGDYYKGDWHFIEAYFQLNSIVEGIGVADGQAQYWYDGELIIDYNNLILRTGENPTMKYKQFLIAPWIGDGSPVEQTFWIDDLTVANYRVGAAPGQATNPSPANSATDVSVDADLSWTAGSGATSHDVYFGTSSPGTFQANQTATTYEPGTMSNDTTYYWRIDEINAEGTTTGDVWSFTTEAEPSPPG